MNPGDYVISRKGRDMGRYFLVMGTDGEYAYLADGRLRRAESPKKKKLKHVSLLGLSDAIVAQRLGEGERVTNSELRKSLAKLYESLEAKSE